jgi:uncharacterized protein with FMN-binding domain
VRKETRLALGVLGLTTLGTSYLVGQNAASTVQVAQALQTSSDATQVPAPEASSEPTSEATSSPPAESGAPAETSTPQETPASSSGTFTSSVVFYRYGMMQLAVTVNGNLIEAIELVKATTDGREYAQVPPMLVDLAMQAQSSNFGNISRATFTTEAFKKALDDALAQAGM